MKITSSSVDMYPAPMVRFMAWLADTRGITREEVLFMQAFLQNNRLDHITQVLNYHPQYLEHFLKTQQFMLRGDGPLPYHFRHYIAIMASARHRSAYLMNTQKAEFLLQGGDATWLKGLQYAPQKLRDLAPLNRVLAHRPWLIRKGDIETLTKGTNNWSVSELAHAIVLLVHFHSLCSLGYGCGINPEMDHPDGHTFTAPDLMTQGSQPSPPLATAGLPSHLQANGCVVENDTTKTDGVESGARVDELLARMKALTKNDGEEASQQEMLERYVSLEKQATELVGSGVLFSCMEQEQGSGGALVSLEEVGKFMEDDEDASYHYEDFTRRNQSKESIPTTFRVQDYSWEVDGFSLLNRLYPEMGNLLDEKFKVIYDLTYYTMGSEMDVDTTTFRHAIWNYIQCVYGIRHDDYDYGEVNVLLERSMKSFIKTVSCYPERVTTHDYEMFMSEFKHSEKVHVILLISEARMQAELLYALRAVMHHMNPS